MIKLDSKHTVLLVIDVQEDFCSPEGLSAKNGRGIVNIQRMLPELKNFQDKVKRLGIKTVFTRFIRRSKHDTPQNLNFLTEEARLTPVCVEGTRGAEIYYFTPRADDVVIDKQYYDCFAGTQLFKILKECKTENILITGVRTDICIDTTGKRALSEGFIPIVISNLVATTDERKNVHDTILETFKKYHGVVIESEEVLRLLNYNRY